MKSNFIPNPSKTCYQSIAVEIVPPAAADDEAAQPADDDEAAQPADDDEVVQPAADDEVVPSLDHQLKSWKWMKKVGLHFYHEHQ
ncbi:unnamed protein product [Lathyrus oleraceus]